MLASRTVIAAAVLSVLSAAPVMAQPPDRGDTPGLGWGSGGSKGAPGPIAGAGLPVLLVAGALAYARHRRSKKHQPPRL
jgi:hypothetical protein